MAVGDKLSAKIEEATKYREWICEKCGLLRSNRKTHKHGVEME